jgi:hypothetical protein
MSNCASYMQFQSSKIHVNSEISIVLKFTACIWGILQFAQALVWHQSSACVMCNNCVYSLVHSHRAIVIYCWVWLFPFSWIPWKRLLFCFYVKCWYDDWDLADYGLGKSENVIRLLSFIKTPFLLCKKIVSSSPSLVLWIVDAPVVLHPPMPLAMLVL